jgi:hypothetical protein
MDNRHQKQQQEKQKQGKSKQNGRIRLREKHETWGRRSTLKGGCWADQATEASKLKLKLEEKLNLANCQYGLLGL